MFPHSAPTSCVSRRRFLRVFGTAAPVLALPEWVFGEPAGVRVLSFSHLHTGERLRGVEYCDRGGYLPDGLRAIDRILRDFRTGDVRAIDPGLLDLLHVLTRRTGTGRPFEVISGYRSPGTNRMLRQRGRGVAAGSLHTTGQAIDIRLADVPLASLHEAALAIRGGGVGYYPASNFVHVDTGRVRQW